MRGGVRNYILVKGDLDEFRRGVKPCKATRTVVRFCAVKDTRTNLVFKLTRTNQLLKLGNALIG